MDRFSANLNKWSTKYPNDEKDASILEANKNFEVEEKPSVISFCQTASGLPNLKRETSGGTVYLHSQEDPVAEANQWFSSLTLNHSQVIFIYGVGLGYYYKAALEWLREDKDRYLVFLEDDPQVLHCFLETETCTEMLEDPQVMLILIGGSAAEEVFQFTRLGHIFTLSDFIYTGLACYIQNKPVAYFEYKSTVSFMTNLNKALYSETASFGIPFYRNYFSNFLDVTTSHLGNGLLGKFKNVPAIICGAGPSLNKNMDVLATLHDRALIFAGGTALNALNAKGVMPHFGVGIDPNPDQFTRLVMNHAYELPFLYRCRMLHEALNIVHGDRLYVTGSGGYEIGKWLEKKLDLDEPELEEGFNVLNFSVLLAHAMGCNPIICVGIDLAYSDGNSYAAGVVNHPVHDLKGNFRTKNQDEELVSKQDIYGRPIYTLWKWIAESMWYTHFFDTHPETLLINATEGGIGFPRVVNKSLKEVRDEYLNKQLDLTITLHAEIQNSPLPAAFNETKIIEEIRSLIDGVSRCGSICQGIVEKLLKQFEKGIQQSLLEEIALEESKLVEEEAYHIVLKKFDDDYLRVHGLAYHRLLADEGALTPEEFGLQKAQFDLERYHFLKEAAFLNTGIVYSLLKNREDLLDYQQKNQDQQDVLLKHLREKYSLPKSVRDEGYFFDQKVFRIKDIELTLDYTEELPVGGNLTQETLSYPSGKVKFERFYQDGALHGPSVCYSEKGALLAKAWFVHGKQEGKMFLYHANGSLHSLQRFRSGLKVGLQEYFYADGTPKSILPYKDGVLHGEVYLYSPKGVLIRHLNFIEGKRTGLEQIWNDQGVLKIECEYDNDKPIGLSRIWHPNGLLAKEILYDKDSKRLEEKNWSFDGQLIEEKESLDYFDQVHKQTDVLTASLNEMVAKMSQLAPLYSEKVHQETPPLITQTPAVPQNDLAAELAKLQQEMQHLQALDEKIKTQLMGNENNPKEAIWKTPSSRQQMESQFDAVRSQMNQEMEEIQNNIKQVISSLLKKSEEEKDK